jgi:hypothetical protein
VLIASSMRPLGTGGAEGFTPGPEDEDEEIDSSSDYEGSMGECVPGDVENDGDNNDSWCSTGEESECAPEPSYDSYIDGASFAEGDL